MKGRGLDLDERRIINQNSRGYNLRGRSLNPYQGDSRNAETGENEENLRLVPCRWAPTGWKYVRDDPGGSKFFGNPNRVNSFGFGH